MENSDINPTKKIPSIKPNDIKKLEEILEIEKLSRLLERFYYATGLSNYIFDLKGNILHEIGWKSICADFYQKNAISVKRCLKSNILLANSIKKNVKYTIYNCQNGLIDIAIPIVINDAHVANLCIGQFFFELPNKDLFNKQAEELGFNKTKYQKALDECQVYNQQLILRYLDFLSDMVNMICESAQKSIDKKKQDKEKNKRAAELVIADKELVFQTEEKADRAAELLIADKELVFQSGEKADRAAELAIANKELLFQNAEKEKRASELLVANKELIFQNEEKANRAAELVIANKELVFQNEEKEKRASELLVANEELVFQNEEKVDRAAELVIANNELIFQNEEKADRAAELVIANKELIFQNEEKEKRASELLSANKELALQNEEISYISYHDYLTGLYNRIYFEKVKKRLDTPEQLPLSIIMGDINGLKLVNDGFGHAKGDEILIKVAKILNSCSREKDIVSRIGGDEFGILLPKTDSETAQRICNSIYDACKNYALDGNEIYPSISIGYATKFLISESLDNILMGAEESMSKQKLLESKSAHSSIMASIKAIMFEKSQETEEHAERMVKLSKLIGKAMRLSDDQLNELELVSTLHDIGKMGISADILSKNGKLSEEEWVEIRKHPEIGFRIAQATSEFIPIAKLILCHHERWDGKGYPQGLVGDKIPLLSRIVAIVDSYDAMTNDRVYRLALTKAEAIEEIKRNSGTQFDPNISKLFLKIMT